LVKLNNLISIKEGDGELDSSDTWPTSG